MFFKVFVILLSVHYGLAYWDDGTTTEPYVYAEDTPRQGFFRWQRPEPARLEYWYPNYDWDDLKRRRFLNCVAGISIDFLPLSTGIILNRRTIITAANFLEPYISRMRDVRIWALGRSGTWIAPYRYRVWRWRRIIPKSLNVEHYHGPRGRHIPRHDIAIVHSWDAMYIYSSYPTSYHYAYRAMVAPKTHTFYGAREVYYVGSGYEYMTHIKENYKIFFGFVGIDDIRNCEKYLPKFWGKFVCTVNRKNNAGLQNGGGMFVSWLLSGLGCFEIRYNEQRIHVFTDLRYYNDLIYIYSNLSYGEYYEYAYQQWGINLGRFWDSNANDPYIPSYYITHDIWPLGK